ncbi:hypothetical protein [Pseudoalteromonas sp.]|uniref:hypothetical protein n=1 Tax=Pseudoalteromonas sp. TaxID=53249 RepID=UPI003569E841
MDILTPFLPRINFVQPVDKSTLFVAGVCDNKTTKVRLKKNETTLYDLKENKEEQQSDTQDDDESGDHIDTWV